MRSFDGWGRRLIIGVLFFAATAALCVDAEAQNQRTRRAGNRPAASNAALKKPGASGGMITKPNASKSETKETKTTPEENAPKATAPVSTPAAKNEAGTTTLKKEAVAAVEGVDGEELTASEGKEGKSVEEIIAEIKGETDASDSDAGKYSSEPLDPTATKLPPEYLGHNVEAITERVGRIFAVENIRKDEYEKTADYKKRIAAFKKELPEKSLYGNVKFGSTFALALTQNGERGISVDCKYDADAEKFAVSFGYDVDYQIESYINGFKGCYGVSFNRKLVSSETYIGTNNFGVEKEIKKERWESYGITYTDVSELKIDYNSALYLQNVPANQARAIGESLSALCVFQLGCLEREENGALTPFAVLTGSDSTKPTMDRPYDMLDSQHAVCATIPEFWLYNFKTGEVYAKYSLKDLKTGKAKKIGDFDLSGAAKAEEKESASESEETAEEKAERVAREAAENLAKERRRAAEFWENGNKRLDNRLAAVKRLTSSREIAAPLTIAVPGDCATLREALDKAAKEASKDEIPRIVLDAGEYDASGLTLKTFVDVQSASGKPEDVVLTVDAASPITVDGETVASFDGVTLRQVGGGAKSGACVEVKRGIALFYGCVFDGKKGAKSATGVKAVGLKSAAVCQKCVATGFSLSALHVEDGAFGWAGESVFGPKNRFGASSKAARLEAEKCEFRGNETALYFRGIATGGAQECVYAENKRDAQILDGAKVEVDAPNVDAEK